MTIETTTNRATFAGNDATVNFSFPYYFLADADLVVILVDADGVATTQVLDTDYTLSGAGNPAGGTVTMITAPATGETLIVYRDPAITQSVDLVEGDSLPVETAVERPLDRLTMIAQRLDERVNRSMRLADEDTSTADLEMPSPEADALLGWNAAADGLENKVPADLSLATVSPYIATLLDDTTAAAARATLGAMAKDFTGLTAETAPDTADSIPLYDASEGATNRITLENLLKVINGLTADATPDPDADYVATYDASAAAPKKVLLSGIMQNRNHIINGDFRIAQRGTSFTSATTPANNDDTYLLDRWILLSDGNDVVDVSQESSVVPTNGLNAIALDVETINKKFGILQIIEQKNCIGLIGNTVTVTFKAKVSDVTKLDNVKAAILAWNGTADAVTSDVVSAWNIEGTDPTLVANWTYENTPSNLGLTTSYATFTVTANIDTASAKNIALLVWSDVTDTTLGHLLYITDVKLEKGGVATPFVPNDISDEENKCLRYFNKTLSEIRSSYPDPGTSGFVSWLFPVRMRTTPTITYGGSTTVTTNNVSADLLTGTCGTAYPVIGTGTTADAEL